MLYILMRWVALHLCRAAESHQRRSALHCRCRRPALVTRRHTSPHTSTHSWLVLTPLTLFSPPCSPHSVSPFISFISGSSLYQWLSRVVHFFDFSARAFLASYFPHFHVAFFKPCLISLCFLFFFFLCSLSVHSCDTKEDGLKCHMWQLHFILHIHTDMSR